MDEVEWMKNTKKAIIFICKIIFILILIFELANFLGLLVNSNDTTYTINTMLLLLAIGLAIIFSLFLLLFVLNLLYKIMYRGNKVFIWEKEYIRDFPKDCSSAIASLLYDLKVDVYKDYTAIILQLYLKKYIDIIHSNNEYKIVALKEDELFQLTKHEKYAFYCVTNKEKFNENKFKKLILEDAKNSNLITNIKNANIFRVIPIIVFTFLILLASYFINMTLFLVLLCIVLSILLSIAIIAKVSYSENIVLHLDTNYKRTKKGTEKAIQISALKQFIHDYTLIKNKPIDYVEILNEYIPYALSLDEANQIEDFIKNNDIYRNLIYPNSK